MNVFERYAPFIQDYIYRSGWQALRSVQNAAGEAIFGPEDNVLLSRYGNKGVLKIAQLHQDHALEPKLVRELGSAYSGVDVLAMLTPGLAAEVQDMMRGNNTHTEVVYIPNFLEHFPESTDRFEREKTVLAVGRLNEVKRFDLLIRLFHVVHTQFPEWKLRVVGEGEEREKLEAAIRELDAADYVTLTGKKDAAGVEEEMLRASICAMTSRSEGFPFVLLEAESCALPIVAFDVRVGPGFVVQDGVNGCLAPDLDYESFCEKLASLMKDGAKRLEMAEAAKAHAAQFSRERVGEIWYSLIGD